ncbi:Protein of unknown function [Burkholderia sp. YR290]|uniref:DUF3175 domain-containing protein n=1 Tax=Paraburkholderia hospita TaxID=169430 RepID=UPI0009A56284|nr:DUF3175 domain-containing protein [Paraburkholderia hospita]SKC92839.1 Protein of unknown function [Paraburkholderia hospita]SOE90959.1 Protein of unknown function [Burkholderia sp. YR290]
MGNTMASTSKRSGTSRAKKSTTAHASTRGRGGRPPRQRHSQASAAHRARTAASSRSGKNSKYWSHHVMETSDAMDIEKDIFRTGTADEIAQSLKRSSTHSKRRKGTPYQSAMSMLNFYINRAGRNLPKSRKSTLEQAKRTLREAFGRTP